MPIIAWLSAALDRQRGHMFPWAPVCFGAGIGLYFALRAEPSRALLAGLALAGAVALVLGLRVTAHWGLLLVASGLIALGLARSGMRTAEVAAPVLGFRYYGPIEGRLIDVDRSLSDAPRLTLDRVRIARTDPAKWPARVRVALHGDDLTVPPVGARVMLTGHLSPPQGPVEPGGYDFQRSAWFARLGAVGYTRSPVVVADPPRGGSVTVRLARARSAVAGHVRRVLPGDAGGVAAAVMTGDRSGIRRAVIDDLRASNLAHLLAISGLHMGLLTGFVFAAVRLGLAAIPWVAVRWPVKKIAAAVALVTGAGYLALSGGAVATERAFVMVAVMFAAVLMDRRALTLRAVALAALIVLTLRPEALVGPGFQMSFAATTALVAVFGAIRDWPGPPGGRFGRGVLGLVVSSAVAGLATAPIAAAQFNQVSHYGLLANLAAVPVMGLVVVPAAVLASLLSPFGADGPAFWVMGRGLDWILGVAHRVAALPGAVGQVPAPPGLVLPVLALGGLVLMLWRGRARAAGLVPMAFAFGLWAQAERPAVLIASDGGLVGVMTSAGRAISKPRGDGFAALSWLENDGDPVSQRRAASRPGWQPGPAGADGRFDGLRIAHLTGVHAPDAVPAACAKGGIVVTDATVTARGCMLFDAGRLKRLGAVALDSEGGSLVSARRLAGRRPWNVQ